MITLIFGIICTIISSLFLIISTILGFKLNILFIIVPLLFIIIGIILILISLKKIIKNKKADISDEICYGIVKKIYNSGTIINGIPELKADFLVYIESQNKIETASEIVGLGISKYNLNEMIKLKYNNGSINFIEEITDYTNLSTNVQDFFEKNKLNENNVIGINEIR